MAKSFKAFLSGAFSAAALDGLVVGNPVQAVKLPRQVRSPPPGAAASAAGETWTASFV